VIQRCQYTGCLRAAKWIGTAAGVAGATLIALNLGAVEYGFALFLVSSLIWSTVGWIQRELSLLVLQVGFTAINLVGIWQWSMV
jgi:nicotinamide riboside transporter PnuC